MDDEVDIAPVDAEIERRGAHHGPQPSRRHRVLDLAALADVERAVMQRDRQIVLVRRHSSWKTTRPGMRVLTKTSVVLWRLIARRSRASHGGGVSGPGHALAGIQNARSGWRRRPAMTRSASAVRWRLRHQPAPQLVRIGDRRRQADRSAAAAQASQPRQAERQQIAALRGDAASGVRRARRSAGPRKARGASRRRSAARAARAWSAGCRAASSCWRWRWRMRRVAGAGLDADRQAHLGDRLLEVARDVDGQRLQRRDVERVQPRAVAGLRWRGW